MTDYRPAYAPTAAHPPPYQAPNPYAQQSSGYQPAPYQAPNPYAQQSSGYQPASGPNPYPAPNPYASAPTYPPQPNFEKASAPLPAASAATIYSEFKALCNYPSVRVIQKVEKFEVITGYETGNKYSIIGPNNELLFSCAEKSSFLAKMALKARRNMDILIADPSGAIVMTINRPLKLWHKNVTVCDSTGKSLGSVLKKFSVSHAIFHVFNASEQQIFTIQGGMLIKVGGSRKLSILNSQGVEVGHVQKEWGGVAKEILTDADNFTLVFPPDANAETRALLIALVLFIDLTHFEK